MTRRPAYTPIHCDDHDRIEIACLDRYEVLLQTDDGEFSGRALTTETRTDGEFLCLQTTAGAKVSVRLDAIRRMTVVSRPCRFEVHDFRVAGN